ncbi:MAG: sulfatase family protein, partial [Planctomycetaceae bacterium]
MIRPLWILLAALAPLCGRAVAEDRPNILWISCEDTGVQLGCYGDEYATTPNIDRLASEGAVFTNCFTHSGVCAVSRSGIISGVYPVSIGSQHMRSRIVPPAYVKCFPEYLRAAGYYCTNRSKTDYNWDAPLTAWDENGRNHDDWRGRAEGQPFFSVINLTVSHESQIRAKFNSLNHDPDTVTLPPYIPDTPETRRDRARYYDIVSTMDRQAGEILRRLEEDGLAENTIVFFWGDHGEGLPRGKRWIYDSGIHVPLVVRRPGTIEPGTVRDDLVCFLDLAPTVLSLAGVAPPGSMQGQVILGDDQAPPRQYVFAHRDRMDETYDLIRAARDKRFKYIRNFMPERSYGQNIDYMNLMPTMITMRRLHAAGELSGPT